jgi:hypothetical protein
MRVHLNRYTNGLTPWGVFTNLWPTTLSRMDRATLGCWYFHVHTPFLQIQINNTTD